VKGRERIAFGFGQKGQGALLDTICRMAHQIAVFFFELVKQ
jgi:hypothetical protein